MPDRRFQTDEMKEDVDLPPCWKEDPAGAIGTGVDRLWVHLDGPGFIGMDGDELELVRAELRRGEEPEPETRPATAENVRELAESYNNDWYGNENQNLEGVSDAE